MQKTQNKNALSPVVASIILLAVVVAVSMAATTWMGSMTFNFMEVDELSVTDCTWASDYSYADITVRNLGTSSVSVREIQVNGKIADEVTIVSGESMLDAGQSTVFRITQSFTQSKKYEIAVVTSATTRFPIVDIASSSSSSETWYDSLWAKRKAVIIDNSLNPEELIDYQIQITVEYDSDMLPTFSDLRFTSNDKQTLIPYWIERYVSSNFAVVWVKVPFISSSAEQIIYMYYGNPAATTDSDPDDTFDTFVDFTRDGVISYGGSSQDVNPTQFEIVDDCTLRMWGNNWKATLKTLTITDDGSQAICFDYKSEGVQAEINGIGVDTDSSISNTLFYKIYGTQNWGLNDHQGYTGSGDWQSYSLILDNFSGNFNRFVFTNDADEGQATNIYYRNVRICQYTVQAPNINVGTEENR